MKSEWHRYNLKRRVAQLPPINEELFNTKVASLASAEEPKEKQLTKKEQRRKEKEAILEQKRQILEQAKKAMLAKMQENGGELPAKEQPQQEQEPKEDVVEEKPELTEEQQEEQILKQKLANKTEIPPTTCLFAHPKYNHTFETIDENIEHMFKTHGLYIPESKYLVDKEGLLEYLGEKIGFGFCIACNYQGKHAEAAREHMQQKRHMRIPYETEDEKLEISKFYDFSSTYEDGDVLVSENVEGDDDGEWEDVSGDEVDDDEEEDDLPPVERDAIYQHGHELHLPSGAIVGHRSQARYYRQNLAPERELSEGQGTVIAAETRHMLTLKDRQELDTKKRTWKREKKSEDLNDRRAAKFINNQPHFRDPLLQ
ncbi:putative zinc finger protein [Candida maltosa Xu316]|uniref:Putative zinc finger protein n=1 Tax=Candida maltosa (strain Xu316) TaxID=1245528 RepID=M3HK59_CANMX|nr:putative zinc finger protein [Candida maltosa Xu316]